MYCSCVQGGRYGLSRFIGPFLCREQVRMLITRQKWRTKLRIQKCSTCNTSSESKLSHLAIAHTYSGIQCRDTTLKVANPICLEPKLFQPTHLRKQSPSKCFPMTLLTRSCPWNQSRISSEENFRWLLFDDLMLYITAESKNLLHLEVFHSHIIKNNKKLIKPKIKPLQ